MGQLDMSLSWPVMSQFTLVCIVLGGPRERQSDDNSFVTGVEQLIFPIHGLVSQCPRISIICLSCVTL